MYSAISIESCQDCVHVNAVSKRMALCVQQFVSAQMAQHKLTCFSKHDHSGVWRKLQIRSSSRTRQFVVTLELQTQHLSPAQLATLKQDFVTCVCAEAQHIRGDCGFELKGVSFLANNSVSTRSENSCPIDVAFGAGFFTERMCGLLFRVSATAFFQVNTASAERLYAATAQWALKDIAKERRLVLLDVCCGTGTIGLCVARVAQGRVRKVVGLELCADAVKDAQLNARSNGFERGFARFVSGKAEETISRVLREEVAEGDFVVAIVDPPRCGLHKDICAALRQQQSIARVVYVSCNAASCVADALRFCKTCSKKCVGMPFRPVGVLAVDLFPHTEHVEMLMLMQRCREQDVDWTTLSHQASESQRKYLYQQSLDRKKAMVENDVSKGPRSAPPMSE